VRLTDLLTERRVVVPLPATTLEKRMRFLVAACPADGRVQDLHPLDLAISESWPADRRPFTADRSLEDSWPVC
jgi:hypothetical protein